jgi:uncharacterized protein YaeQ
VALTATIYNFDIDLADSDRGIYETLALRVARHPSESEDYLIARLLAYCLEFGEGIGFSSGISDPDDPAISVRDLTGVITSWIDIGSPEAARLHKAAKIARRVAVYCHKDPAQWLRQLSGARIHRADSIEVYGFEPSFIKALTNKLTRRMAFGLTVTDGYLLAAFDDGTADGRITRHVLAAG